ncbi:decapping nuclease DXO homolog [Episyrphus balteatus]|uniref:decapping nuclease DXO homolog n=1 Tax=Episyrphus balteatus TaxID=286459 RepID=UPI00248686BD|nr:decapping nuclease DXO homolog [Episyrphus balteatus]
MDASFKNSSPQICGFYSITPDREYDSTASSLRYFKKPKVFPLDLNIGIETIRYKPDSYYKEKMDSILTYIVKHKADLLNGKKTNALIPSTKYITYRGVIRKIMCSPFEKRSGWCILATKYKNNIYMCQLTREEVLEAFNNEPMSTKRFCYYGPKFEQYCLTDDPASMPNTSQQIDAREQFFCVFKRKLVGRDFLFAGEMDGIVSDKRVTLKNQDDLQKLNFIELKVSADPSASYHGPRNFKQKIQNVWTQSYLSGVKDVFFGMRDGNGLVHKIQHFSTDELLRLGQTSWDPLKCFKFLEEFLKLVEEKMANIDCPNTVFEFNFNEKTVQTTCKEHHGKTELSLIPNWYLNAFNK